MKIIQSLSTTRINDETYIQKILDIYQCSIKMARRFHPITLYTDERGANELGHLVDEVKFLKKDTIPYLWDEPKFEVFKNETGEFIHMDGDIFIAEPLVFPKEYDVLYDFADTSEIGYIDSINALSNWGVGDILPEWNSKWNGAYNTGIIGFKDPLKMKKYVDSFYSIKTFYYKNYGGVEIKYAYLTLEQALLKLISDNKGWNSLPMNTINSYIHIYSFKKYQLGFMELVRTMNKSL